MAELVILSVFVIIIMIMFVFFVFRNIIKRINKNAKKYFIDKLQDYNYIIDEKKAELKEIEKQIEEKKQLVEYTEDIKSYKVELVEEAKEKDTKEEVIYDIPSAEYRQDAFFTNYKNLKSQFNINNEKVIMDFIKNNVTKNNAKEQKEYEVLSKFLNYFDSKTTYECMTLTHEEQYQIINEIIKKSEKGILQWEDYKRENFEITKFLNIITQKIKKIDPTIHIYVSNENLNYEKLNENIKMHIYQNMTEGVIIKYRDKTYDYSI